MILHLDTEDKRITLEADEQGILMRECHNTPFTTGQVMQAYIETITSNFEQDIHDVISELEQESDE